MGDYVMFVCLETSPCNRRSIQYGMIAVSWESPYSVLWEYLGLSSCLGRGITPIGVPLVHCLLALILFSSVSLLAFLSRYNI